MKVNVGVVGEKKKFLDTILIIKKYNTNVVMDIELLQLKNKNPNSFVEGRFPGEAVKVIEKINHLERTKRNNHAISYQFTVESICNFLLNFPYYAKDKSLYLFFKIEGEGEYEAIYIEIRKKRNMSVFTIEQVLRGLRIVEDSVIKNIQ